MLPFFSLRTSILFPLVSVLLVLISVFVYAYYAQEKAYREKHVSDQFSVAQKTYYSSLKLAEDKLSATLSVISMDSALKQAMVAGDREGLFQHANLYFKTLRDKNEITHFYFHLPDRINFLRVHQPERHDDKISRLSILQAEATSKPASVLELGPLGLFTLRVVFPWYNNDVLIGYIELGQEVESIYGSTKDVSNTDLQVMLNKQFLVKKDWEDGMRLLGRKANWDLFPDSIVSFSTLPEAIEHAFNEGLLKAGFKEKTTFFLSEKQVYEVSSLPLTDPQKSNTEIGRIFFIDDISLIKQQGNQHLTLSVVFGLLFSGLLILFFYLLTRRVEKQMDDSSKSLELSEMRFRSLVESSGDLIWEIDADMRYRYVSPKVKEILGYETNNLVGKALFELMPVEEIEKNQRLFVTIIKEGRSFNGLEKIAKHKDGHLIVFETSGSPVFDEHGALIGYRGTDRDITQKKHNENELRKTTEKLSLYFQQTPLAVIEWDIHFNVLDWNFAAEEMFGYTKVEAAGCSAGALIINNTSMKHMAAVWELLLSGKGGYRTHDENRTKEGKIICCEWYNTPIKNERGEVIGVVSLIEDDTEQKKAKEKIEHLAYYDTLTLLPNRILFRDYLEQACLDAGSNNGLVGVLFIDIDHFKTINDTLGHAAGDLLIQSVAFRLRDCIGTVNKLSRFGGDEFAVLLANLRNKEQVDLIVKSIFKKFKEVIRIQGYEFFVTLSIGSSIYPLDDAGIDYLLRDADTAMHLAKKMGRNQHQHYCKALTDAATQTLALQNGLRKALQNNELVLHYQPQMNLLNGQIIGAEALVRWQHPEEGLKSPAEFITAAEETGLIVQMGKWILQTACEQAKVWQDQGLSQFTMAINLSARQFKEEGFAQSVIDVIQKTGVDAHLIELELTESILADNTIAVGKILDDLKKVGIKISLDDFGTGYSSLSYLKLFPIDKLKIDQSFVHDMLVDKSDASLVRAIIAMAKALGLTTIAEGVESKEQLDFLDEEGCEEIQGYWLSRPIPAEAFQQFLDERKSM